MNNFIVIVLDGVGIGELPDAKLYKDEGSNTLKNISTFLNGIYLPNLEKLGLGNIGEIKGIHQQKNPLASFGKMNEASRGKDSTTGHWELGGIILNEDFDYFPNGFPKEIISKFLDLTKCKGILGNKAASGTEIIKELGEEHLRTSFPIVYTSADSVFQIAAHEEHFGLKRLYEVCEITRNKVLASPLKVGRVIARPFVGTIGNFSRTVNRKDYSLDPPSDTILDYLNRNNVNTIAIGKINDLFNHKGISIAENTKSNKEGSNKVIDYVNNSTGSFICANLVDFDVYYGHRNDPQGFYKALKDFDDILPQIINSMDESDRLVITADHGNDPTTVSTDHSREYIPLIYYGKNKPVRNLGIRKSFADVAKTAADFFGIKNNLDGISFLDE